MVRVPEAQEARESQEDRPTGEQRTRPAAADGEPVVGTGTLEALPDPDEVQIDPKATAPRSPWDARTDSLVILAVLAIAYTLYFARAILLPLTMAFVLALLFRPFVRHLRKRWHLPQYAGAGAVLAVSGLTLAVVVSVLAGPTAEFFNGLQSNIGAARVKLEAIAAPVARLTELSEAVDDAMDRGGTERPLREGLPIPLDDPIAVGEAGRRQFERARAALEFQPRAQRIIVETNDQPKLTDTITTAGQEFLAGAVLAVVFLFFLLGDGDSILNNVVKLVPTFREKRGVVELVRTAEKGMSRYLMTVTVINALLGVCIGTAMWCLGLPNPFLWGVMACLLNYVPFIGAAVGAAVVFLIALLQSEFAPWWAGEPFDFSIGWALLAPVSYLTINLLEGNFITPAMLGKSISLNPILVFISLAFFGWIWGPAGAILAVPLLSMFKIVCEQFEYLQPVASLMDT